MKIPFVNSRTKNQILTATLLMGAFSAHADCIPAYRHALIELKNEEAAHKQSPMIPATGSSMAAGIASAALVEALRDAKAQAAREKAQDVEMVLRLLMQARTGEGDQFDPFLEKVAKVVGVPHVDSTAVQIILFDASSSETLCPVSHGLIRDQRRLMSEAEVINFVAEQINRFGRECSWSDCSTVGHRIVP